MSEVHSGHGESLEFIRSRVGVLEELLEVHEETVRQQTAKLEELVRARTQELRRANEQLQQEIAERDRVQEALRTSERSHREIFNAATDAILVHDIQTGDIVDANQTACQLLGCTYEEALRLRLGDLSLGEPPYTAEDAQRKMHEAVEHGSAQFEWLLKTRNGEVLWAEVVLKRAAIDGRDRVLIVARDIRPRKKTEAELARHREHLEELVKERTAELAAANRDLVRLKTAIEQSLDGIAVIDLEGKVEFVNVAWAAMHGCEADSLHGVHCRVFHTPQQYQDEVVPFLEAVRQHGSRQGEVGHTRQDGSEFPAWMSATILHNEQGSPTGFIGVARDITAQKRAEAERARLDRQLLETSRRVGMADVATSVLHNVGNVLNSVNVSGTLVTDKVRNSKLPQLLRAVERMQEHADDLGAFVTEHPQGKHVLRFLTELSAQLTREREDTLAELRALVQNVEHVKQIVSTQQSYAKPGGVTVSVPLGELVEDALQIQMASLVRHGIEIVREVADLPPVEIDKPRAMQILVNLLANAKQALRDCDCPNKRLSVRAATAPEGRFRIEVEDNGVGISAENLKRVFTHGFTTKSDGHGYGLHNSALAAQEMNGSLQVKSDGAGRGATFTLELPVKPTETTACAQAQSSETAASS